MAMNPDSNTMEILEGYAENIKAGIASNCAIPGELLRPNGEPVPVSWKVFRVGETYQVNGYSFKCVYFNENTIVLEPAGPILVGDQK